MTKVPVTRLLSNSVMLLRRIWICWVLPAPVCCCALSPVILFLRPSKVLSCFLMSQMSLASPSHHTCTVDHLLNWTGPNLCCQFPTASALPSHPQRRALLIIIRGPSLPRNLPLHSGFFIRTSKFSEPQCS